MLLEELVRCLEVRQGRLRAHPGALQRNEAQTRLALIDPLLRALDWDVSDPSMVTPEYPVENRRVEIGPYTANERAVFRTSLSDPLSLPSLPDFRP